MIRNEDSSSLVTLQEKGTLRTGLALPLTLTLFALAVRIAVCWLVVHANVHPQADEVEYLQSARGWADVLRGLAHGHLPDHAVRIAAWHNGTWPPVHPFVLAWGWLAGGLAGARMLLAVLGGFTTLFIWRFSRVMAGRRAAVVASTLFAVYPSFIAFSHLLWSETTALFLLAIFLSVIVGGKSGRTASLTDAGWMGGLAGLCVLTREAMLPIVFLILSWRIWNLRRDHRLRVAIVSVFVAGCVILPWSVGTSILQGRVVFATNSGGLNLYLGNNPVTPPIMGSAWGVPPLKKQVVERAIEANGGHQGSRLDSVAARLAVQEMVRHPVRTIERVAVRFAQLWSVDFFPLRHIAAAHYPPVPPWALVALGTWSWLSLSLLLFLASTGLMSASGLRHRSLIVLGLLGGMVGPLLSISMSRLQLPLLLLLLPAAGAGLVGVSSVWRRNRWVVAGWLLVGLLLPVLSIHKIVAWELEPSSYYSGVLTPVARRLGVLPLYSDFWECRSPLDESRLRLPDNLPEGYPLKSVGRPPSLSLNGFAVFHVGVDRPLSISVGDESGPVELTPSRSMWNKWARVGNSAMECQWLGSAPSSRWSMVARWSPSGPRLDQP